VDIRARLADQTLSEFEDGLASAEPVPGGGSASAIAGSMAASLLSMVARLSVDRPKYEAYQATHQRALEVGESARTRLLQLADEDARAYAAFAAARKMPRETAEQQQARDEASRLAAREAAEVPLAVVRECARVALVVEPMAGRSNLNAASDLEVAARLSAAAARGAAANVIINLPMVGDDSYTGMMTLEVSRLLESAERAAALVTEQVSSAGLREPEVE
jgi:formiminotetrahydrofolate cyclodeaminase